MKKIFILTLLVMTLTGCQNKSYNDENIKDIVYYLKNYDIAVTRRDINCHTKVFYLNKYKILVTSKENDSQDFSINTINNIENMLNYIEEFGRKNNYEGLYIITKDGKERSIPDSDNPIYDKLQEENLMDCICEHSPCKK